MANLKLIKKIAEIKGMTIEQLAAKAEISTQAIHLMGRSGKTKMETLEQIAKILEVPAYIFFDENFDIRQFRDYVVQGHHNPTSFFGPIYNGGDVPFPPSEREVKLKEEKEMDETKIIGDSELIKAKDETIGILRKQVEDLLADKSEMRSEMQALKAEIADLRERLKSK
jgi:transcriptional regulator with XRE-family HTH domain